MTRLGLQPPIRYYKVSGGKPLTYADVVVLWNHSPYLQPARGEGSAQLSRLRLAFNGQRFAYAHRNDAQRRRAFQRVSEAYPDQNSKSSWVSYFEYIAHGDIPFPEGVKDFRPTIDWALTCERFGFFLEIRRQRRLAKEALEARQN
ncbi:MAG: hypothetical protein Q7J29_06060 [Stagnimonas sp.]|nr:hypothetical protein [Stagnimonas sp.]